MKNIDEYYFYVLYSLKDNRLYKGYSSDFSNRFLRHNSGGVPSTQNRRPLILIHLEKYSVKKQAMDRERFSKTPEGGIQLKQFLISKNILDSNGKLAIERPSIRST